jgi:tripartite-type tricarboxylate transporter receptor subunit TctC
MNRGELMAGLNETARLHALAVAAIAVMTFISALAQAADAPYPQRPVRLISGSVGSTADLTARFIAQKLGERWSHQVVVDNRSGAGGIIGGEIVARSAPDGHTLYVSGISTQVSAPLLFKNVPFDPVKDFAPISLLTNSGLVLVVTPSVPANNVKEFVAYVKGRASGVHYSSAAVGTSSHLTGELFAQATGAKLVHVPYKGTGYSLNALFTGEVQAAFLSTATTSVQVKAGKLKALALLSEKRFAATPEIPTSVEQGYPGLESYVWFGLYAPSRTPRTLIDKINRDVVSILRSPEAHEALLAQGAEAVPNSPEEFAAFQQGEIAKWGKVIRDAHIVAQ